MEGRSVASLQNECRIYKREKNKMKKYNFNPPVHLHQCNLATHPVSVECVCSCVSVVRLARQMSNCNHTDPHWTSHNGMEMECNVNYLRSQARQPFFVDVVLCAYMAVSRRLDFVSPRDDTVHNPSSRVKLSARKISLEKPSREGPNTF